jgi:hypothetical protein
MNQTKPCVAKRDCYFTEDEFVAKNKGTDDKLRASYRRYVAQGRIPKPCDKCGWVHRV